MIDNNTPIEQLIYTACGKNATGAFSVWSASSEELKRERKIIEIMQTIYDGNKVLERDAKGVPTRWSFDPQISKNKVLKAGATPSGLFKKTYKDSDYEVVQNITRRAIHTIQETGSESLRKQIGREDFRGNEENAPFRIGYTQLEDGRLLICRTSAIGSVYAQNDLRTGNLFYHAYIFPAGTEIEDIDVSKVEFVKGLDKKYWSKSPEPAPEFLPKLTLDKLYSFQSQNTQSQTKATQTQQSVDKQAKPPVLMKPEELIELFRNSKLSKDSKEKLEYQKKFSKQVNMGANIPEVINTIYEQYIKKLENGQEITEQDRTVIDDLESVLTPFSEIFRQVEAYYNNKQALNSGDYDDYDVTKQSMLIARQYIKKSLVGVDAEQLMRVAKSTEEYIATRARFNLLEKTQKNFIRITLTTEEEKQRSVANMLFRMAREMHEKQISFEEQKII